MRLAAVASALFLVAGCAGSPASGPSAETTPPADTRPTEEVRATLTDGEWVPSARSLWSYDSDSPEPTGEVSQVWADGAWSNDSKSEWEVDGTGRRIRQTFWLWRDGAWDLHFRGQTRYDADGRRVAERRAFVGESLAGAVDSLVWTYSPDGRTVERRFFRQTGAGVSEFARQRTEYGADGREATQTSITNFGGEWEDDRRLTHLYHPEGRRDRSRVEQWRDYKEEWEHTGNEVYTYDERGRLLFLVTELRDYAVRDSVGWRPFRRTETRYAE